MIEESRHLLRRHAGAFVLLHIGDRLVRRAIDCFTCHALLSRVCEPGADVARHEYTHRDTEPLHFVRYRQRQRIDSRLGGGVERLIRNRQLGGDGGGVDDPSVPLRTQLRQHSLRESHSSHEVDIHLVLRILDSGELHRSGDTETGIGDDDVYMIRLLHHFRNRLSATLLIAYITKDMHDFACALCIVHCALCIVNCRPVSAQFKDTPAPLCEERGCCFSYTGTTAGDN